MFVWGPLMHKHLCNILYLNNGMADRALNPMEKIKAPLNPVPTLRPHHLPVCLPAL